MTQTQAQTTPELLDGAGVLAFLARWKVKVIQIRLYAL